MGYNLSENSFNGVVDDRPDFNGLNAALEEKYGRDSPVNAGSVRRSAV